MSATYDERAQAARARLRAALHPAMADEHRMVDRLLATLTPDEADVWSEMVERRLRTTRRAARMDLAQQTLAFFTPAPGAPLDIVATFEQLAAGGDVDPAVEQLTRDQQIGEQRRSGGAS